MAPSHKSKNPPEDLEAVISAYTDPVVPPVPEAPSEAHRGAEVVRLLPAPTPLAVPRGAGRPKKKDASEEEDPSTYYAAMSQAKASFVDADGLVSASTVRTDSVEMLRMVKSEIAREAAALHFQRLEAEKAGKDTSQLSVRRIDALVKIANMELEIRRLGADIIDLRSEKFQKVFRLWIEMLRQAAAETMNPAQIDLFFNRMSTMLEGWEDKAANLVR